MAEQVLVIGGGVAGLAAATTLTDEGVKVHLVERDAQVGGWVNSLCCKATDVCTRCSVCLGVKEVAEISANRRISIVTHATASKLEGEAGDFRATVSRRLPHVDPETCIACGICTEVCPNKPKAIHPPAAEAMPFSYVLDREACLRATGQECSLCRDACPTGTIAFQRDVEQHELRVASVIVSSGFDVFDAKELGGLGYGRHEGVLTGLDLERRFHTEGALRLGPDGHSPESVAFVQCVGSRRVSHGYCSQACCKYAMRLSLLIKHQDPSTDVAIFYIDLQNAGKGFAQFYEECQKTVRFIRGVPVEVSQTPSGKLEVRFEQIAESRVQRELFDTVVLSVGMVPARGSWELASTLGINLNHFGFVDTTGAPDCVETNVEGIFAAGACRGPKDIPDSIAQGIVAAGKAMEVLSKCRRRQPSFSATAERA